MPSILDVWRVAWTIWFFALGACVGSFLNVAVYRLPAGMNIAYPRSRCPKCGTGIRWYDNVPVLSWLLLGGQCRDCGLPIGLRYPFVELLTGLVFVLVLWLEWFSEAGNVPTRYIGIIKPLGEGMYRLNLGGLVEVMLGFHLLLLVTLLAAALIDFDRHPLPLGLFAPAWLVGLFLPLWYPLLRPVPWDARVTDFLFLNPWWERNTPLAAGYDALPAVAFAVVVGVIGGILSLSAAGSNLLARIPAFLPLATVLLFLGWQATLVAAAGATVLYVLLWLCGSRLTWNGALFLATLATLLTWRHWDLLMPRAGGPALFPVSG